MAENTWAEKVNVMIAGSEKFDTLNLTANSGVWSTYAANGAIVPYTQAVSYTHLDVYKRQMPCWHKKMPRRRDSPFGGALMRCFSAFNDGRAGCR